MSEVAAVQDSYRKACDTEDDTIMVKMNILLSKMFDMVCNIF